MSHKEMIIIKIKMSQKSEVAVDTVTGELSNDKTLITITLDGDVDERNELVQQLKGVLFTE